MSLFTLRKYVWNKLWYFNDNFMHFGEYSLIFRYWNLWKYYFLCSGMCFAQWYSGNATRVALPGPATVMGVALCKPVNGRISAYENGVWLPCSNRHRSMITKVGVAHKERTSALLHLYHVFLNFAMHVIQSGGKFLWMTRITRVTWPGFNTDPQ